MSPFFCSAFFLLTGGVAGEVPMVNVPWAAATGTVSPGCVLVLLPSWDCLRLLCRFVSGGLSGLCGGLFV